ncbi:hypothetical protein CPB83DRAFT_861100 [Crepidotus variabilis]|uniref:Uncharacterized protein n=1 Tax=Crepidotus variabilis TaxID=179855 RepID=A0A9P6E920_9AGAR|nr:hypothetical protein CPB83DRAFT_861100 [Crepidotus variabilis]
MDIRQEDSSRGTNRALFIPEILRLIIRHLHPISDEGFKNASKIVDDSSLVPLSKEVTKSLASVALVCSPFSEHALDYLWWFTNDLTPLFQLLPAFRPAADTVKVSLLDGEIHPTDLLRFNSYACRIRGYRMSGSEHFHSSTIARILRECDRSYLLPALQSLSVSRSPVAVLSFIPPSLQNYASTGYATRANQDPEVYSSISSLPRVTPNLLRLRAFSNLSGPSLKAVTDLTHLNELHLDRNALDDAPLYIDPALLVRMSSANTLKKFRIGRKICFNPFPSSWTGQEITTFSVLETLKITTGAPTIKTLNTLLRSIFLPQLKSLVVDTTTLQHGLDGTERKHWLRFFQLLPDITTKEFKKLRLTSTAVQKWEHRSSFGLSIKDIPELALLSLTHFSVTFPTFSSITMPCLQYLVSHWPYLKSLDINSESESLLDLHALAFLAENLPYLEALILVLPCANDVPFTELPILNHGLRDIILTGLMAPCARDFVRSLDRLFPRLVTYELYSRLDEDQETWDNAMELLEYFQSSRQDQIERDRQ